MIDAELDTGDDNEPDDLPDITTNTDLSSFKKKIPVEDIDKIVAAKVKDEQKKLADEQKRQRLVLKREHQDETRQRRIQSKLDKRAAADRRISIRSSAVSQRIQAYSIASSLGFAGYVAASMVDQFSIRPKEQIDIKAEEAYNANYAAYQQALEADQVERRRAREDEISGMSVDRESIFSDAVKSRAESRADTSRKGFSGAFTEEYQNKLLEELKDPNIDPRHRAFNEEILARNGYKAKNGVFTKAVVTSKSGFKGEFTDAYRSKLLEELEDPNINPRHRAFNEQLLSQNKPEELGLAPDLLKPAIPLVQASFMEKFGAVGMAIAGGITGLQSLNQGIEGAGKVLTDIGKSALTGKATDFLSQTAHLTSRAADPLGINPISTIAVTGFDTLLALTEDIREAVSKDIGFSPITLQASVEGDIRKLMQSIDIAQKNDPIKAQLTMAFTELDLAWNEFKSEALQHLGPAILAALGLIAQHIQVASYAIDRSWPMFLNSLKAIGPWGQAIAAVLEQIAKNTAPQNALTDAVLKQVSDFLDPNNFKDLPKKAFRNNMPNLVP
jgi:hypothetical protein